jgi:hypothetical protein
MAEAFLPATFHIFYIRAFIVYPKSMTIQDVKINLKYSFFLVCICSSCVNICSVE